MKRYEKMPKTKAPEETKVIVERSKMEAAEKKAKTRADVISDAKRRAVERELKSQARIERVTAWAEVKAAKESGRILYARIVGTQRLSTAATAASAATEVVAVALYDNKYKVIIPFSEIYRDNPINMSLYHGFKTLNEKGEVDELSVHDEKAQSEYNRRQNGIIEKLYGYITPFLVMEIEEGETADERVILGSRKKAIRHFTRANFLPREDGTTKIKAGDIVDCMVMSVGSGAIWVNVGGVDTKIPVANLTYRYIGTKYETGEVIKLSKYYFPGQMMKVLIKEVQQTPQGPELIVTAKPTEQIANKVRQKSLITIGMQVKATIVNLGEGADGASVKMMCYLDDYDMPAFVPSYVPQGRGKPERGRTALLTITGRNENNGMLSARCRMVF